MTHHTFLRCFPSRTAFAALAACTLSGALGGCPATHSLEISDTATSWLKPCVTSDECGDFGRCIQQVCTLACSPESRGDCRPLAANASCDAPRSTDGGSCDLACSTRADCATLGSSHECEGGRCRLPSGLSEIAQPLQWTSEHLGTFASARIGDHVRLYYSAYDADPVTWQRHPIALHAVDIYGDGSTRSERSKRIFPDGFTTPRHRRAHVQVSPRSGLGLVVAPDMNMLSDDRTCELHFFPEGAFTDPIVHPYPCRDLAQIAPIPNRDEWFVLFMIRREDLVGELWLGRFSGSARDWSLAPRKLSEFSEDGPGYPSLVASGDDALLFAEHYDGGPAWLMRIPNAATATAAFEATAVQRVDASAVSPEHAEDAPVSWTGLLEDWLVPSWRNAQGFETPTTTLTAFPIQSDGKVGAPVNFRLHEDQAPSWHSMAHAPERGAVGVCYALDEGGHGPARVWLSVFDDKQGKRLAGPTQVAAGEGTGDCLLTWSGSEFVVAVSKYQGQDSPLKMVQARRFSLR